jgi:hypothetical protein
MSKIVITGSGTDLAVLEALTPADLFAPKGTEPVFEAISKEVALFVPDATTESGRKEIASMAYKIAQSKNFLDKVGKIFNSDLKEKTKAVDSERKVIWDKLEALQTQVRAPLDAYEAAEEARVQAHKDAMAQIESALVFDVPNPTIEQIQARADSLKPLCNRQWDEFREMFDQQFKEQWLKLEGIMSAAQKAASDQAELEALRAAKAAQDAKDAEAARQKAADEQRAQIEKDAAEKAQRDAEAAIKAANDAAEAERQKAIKAQAESEARIKASEEARIAAEAKAKLESEQAVQREKDRAAAAQKKLDDEATARENDRAHHAKVNKEATEAVKQFNMDWDSAAELVAAIEAGKIPHIKITY